MPSPHSYTLTLIDHTCFNKHADPETFTVQFEFEAFPSASCTLAQHYAAKCWYSLQARLDSKEESPQ